MVNIAKGVRAARTAGRSPVFRWLVANYQELATETAHLRRMPWSAIAAVMNERGIKLPDGKSISPHAVRKAWPRVLQEANRDASKPVTKPQKPVSAVTPASQPSESARPGRFSIPISKG